MKEKFAIIQEVTEHNGSCTYQVNKRLSHGFLLRVVKGDDDSRGSVDVTCSSILLVLTLSLLTIYSVFVLIRFIVARFMRLGTARRRKERASLADKKKQRDVTGIAERYYRPKCAA